ncbi:MAG: 3,4-dihydroxy-2-butanone-4-phosphate synthase [Hymenobacter sp.]
MVGHNTALHATAFTVSVGLAQERRYHRHLGLDRSKTIQALIDPATKPDELGKPGHIFPLKARKEGVLRRAGHTEAAVDLARLAGFEPAGVLVEILKEDGEMARLPDLRARGPKVGPEADFGAGPHQVPPRQGEPHPPRHFGEAAHRSRGDFDLYAYTQRNSGAQHLALVKGDLSGPVPVLVRVHSSCVTGDIFGSCRCDCGPQLHRAMQPD